MTEAMDKLKPKRYSVVGSCSIGLYYTGLELVRLHTYNQGKAVLISVSDCGKGTQQLHAKTNNQIVVLYILLSVGLL